MALILVKIALLRYCVNCFCGTFYLALKLRFNYGKKLSNQYNFKSNLNSKNNEED